jgi:glycerol kinase
MALQNCDLLLAMAKDSEKKLRILKVDGGASANNMLMQLQADYLNTLIERPKRIETTSMGAGFLAGLGVGFWKSLDEIRDVWALDHSFVPNMKAKERQTRFGSWNRAIRACRKFAEIK